MFVQNVRRILILIVVLVVTTDVVVTQEKSLEELLDIPFEQCVDKISQLYEISLATCRKENPDLESSVSSELQSKVNPSPQNGPSDSEFNSIDEFVSLSSEMKECVLNKLMAEVNITHFVTDCTKNRGLKSIILHPARFSTCFLQQVNDFCDMNSEQSKTA